MLTKADRKRIFQVVAHGIPDPDLVEIHSKRMIIVLSRLDALSNTLLESLGLVDERKPSNAVALETLEEIRKALIKLETIREYFDKVKRDIIATDNFALRAMRQLRTKSEEEENEND